MSYRLGLLSWIPLVRGPAGDDRSMDLWVRDLDGQVDAVEHLTLFAPVVAASPAEWSEPLPLRAGIEVVDVHGSDHAALTKALAACDVLQIPGNFGWWQSASTRRLARLARALGKPVIVGISSNRARTGVLNAAGRGALRQARAWLGYASIRISQSFLVKRSNGVFVVGEGLRQMVQAWNANVFVGTASWIKRGDIQPPRAPRAQAPLRLCAAARLEPMKGIGLAIEALALLNGRDHGMRALLRIAGVGAQEAALRERSAALKLDGQVEFVGSLAYPEPFFALLRDVDLVLLTNLNDEQPRLVFDAISQGCLPVCPDSLPYRALGIPEPLLYRRGDAAALADCIERLAATGDLAPLHAQLREIVQRVTIETMHADRARWIRHSVLHRSD